MRVHKSEASIDARHRQKLSYVIKGGRMNFITDIFKRKKWSKWEHVFFVEDYQAGNKTREILRRVCENTGDVQYKRRYVDRCSHDLAGR